MNPVLGGEAKVGGERVRVHQAITAAELYYDTQQPLRD